MKLNTLILGVGVLLLFASCGKRSSDQNQGTSRNSIPPPKDQPVSRPQDRLQQKELWYSIILDIGKRVTQPSKILDDGAFSEELQYIEVQKFLEILQISSSDSQQLSSTTRLYICQSDFSPPPEDYSIGHTVLNFQEIVDVETRKLLSASLGGSFKEDFPKFTGVPSEILAKFVPEEKIEAVIREYFVFPHYIIAIPVSKGLRIGILSIAPSFYIREKSKEYVAMSYLPKVHVVGLEITREQRIFKGRLDCWVAEGQSQDGDIIEAYIHKNTGLIVAEVVETRAYRVIRIASFYPAD